MDEFNLSPILDQHKVYDEELLSDLTRKFNTFCEEYMKGHDKTRKDAFTEMYCHLAQVLISCEDDAELLKESIETIMAGCLKIKEK